MKKGNTIRLLIKEKNQEGIVLYFNKKKEDVFLPINEIKKKDFDNAIPGGYLDVRIVSSRPKLLVSGKFIHPDEPIIDDYKPIVQNEQKKEEQIPTDKVFEKVKEVMGIKDKIITITKANQFDKGWALFHPYEFEILKNRNYQELLLGDIIKKVTFSNVIDLVLSEPCLSSRIVSEIEWANKYIKINCIVKNKSIVERYSKISFNNVSVDETIDFNYIGIMGKETGFYMIADGLYSIDDSIEKVYFQNKSLKGDYSFLNNTRQIIIIYSEAKLGYDELIERVIAEKKDCYYCVNVKSYNRACFDYARNNSLKLVVSENTRNAVLTINKDNTISCYKIGKGGFYIAFSIESLFSFIGKAYICDFADDTIDTKKLKANAFTCFDGKITALNIEKVIVKKIDVDIKTMGDFVNEKFDYSIVDKHNDYSAVAENVEYQFTLIPPIIDNTYVESIIYNDIHQDLSKWNKCQISKAETIKREYGSFMNEDFGLMNLLDEAETFTTAYSKIVDNCEYKRYYSQIKYIVDIFKYYDENLLNICEKMFASLNEESSESKFDKFDVEIAGYKQTIEEKTALINQGVDVLSNKRRVEILTKKIEDLLALKKRFEGNTSSRNDKNQSSFIERCEQLLLDKHKEVNDDSIGNIVKPKEETKLAKLESFVDRYLLLIKDYIGKCIKILEHLQSIKIPEEYKVYDKDNIRYIVIETIEEFNSTKNICDEFSLNCVTRR